MKDHKSQLIHLNAKFILANFQVVGFDSCPYTAISSSLQPCASINFSDCTNIPPLQQAGS